MNWTKQLKKLGACEEAVEWGNQFATIEEAWQKCERGDWMLWLLGKVPGGLPETASRKRLAMCVCECARVSLPYISRGEEQSLWAIETLEKWARGEDGVTISMVSDAAYATESAAYAAMSAPMSAAWYAARTSILKHCAGIVRAHCQVPGLEAD